MIFMFLTVNSRFAGIISIFIMIWHEIYETLNCYYLYYLRLFDDQSK